jgi:hypothetical protein
MRKNYVPTSLNESINESNNLMTIKRKYGMRPTVTAGTIAPLRNQVLSYVAENRRVSKNELRKFIVGLSEGRATSASSTMWIKRNQQYFIAESKNGITYYKLSQIGQRVLSKIKPTTDILESNKNKTRITEEFFDQDEENQNPFDDELRNEDSDFEDVTRNNDFDDDCIKDGTCDFIDRKGRPGIFDDDEENDESTEEIGETFDDVKNSETEDDYNEEDMNESLNEKKKRLKKLIESIEQKRIKKLNEAEEKEETEDVEEKEESKEETEKEETNDEEILDLDELDIPSDEETTENEEEDDEEATIASFDLADVDVDETIAELEEIGIEAKQSIVDEEEIEDQVTVFVESADDEAKAALKD